MWEPYPKLRERGCVLQVQMSSNSQSSACSCTAPHVVQYAILIQCTQDEGPNPVLLNNENNCIIFVLNFLDTVDLHNAVNIRIILIRLCLTCFEIMCSILSMPCSLNLAD